MPEPAPTPPAEPGGTHPPTDPAPGQPPGDAKDRRDEAFRTRAKELEQENDRLRGSLETYLKREAEAMTAGRLISPADLWLQAKLEDVVGEEGRPDPAKVAAALQALLEVRPHLAPPKPGALAGNHQPPTTPVPKELSWSDVLAPRRRAT
jgi:hypothetical protein